MYGADEASMPASEVGELSSCYRELNAPLREYLLRNTRSPHDAEDLAQEVYLRLARMRTLAGIDDRKAFVFRAAKNLLRDRSRRQQTREKWACPAAGRSELSDGNADPAFELECLETMRELERVLAGLKASTRAAFLWHRVEERAHVEIANRMGVSISMVEKHVRAATAALRAAGICVDRRERKPARAPEPACSAHTPHSAGDPPPQSSRFTESVMISALVKSRKNAPTSGATRKARAAGP
jgi:RNA polymerase sigma factor (sigma-70 family)